MARPKKTDEPAILAKEVQVLELRRAGLTFDAIADQTGLNDKSTAHRYYKRALGRVVAAPAAEVRDLEADRLDRLQVAVWGRALRGDLAAVDRVLRISERRSRLLGLDHADGIAERQLKLEQDKVRLIAIAFGRALDVVDLTPEQRQTMTRVLLDELRAEADDDGGGEVVTGEVQP